MTYGAPHHLVADAALTGGPAPRVRRTRGGDAWEALQADPASSGKPKVSLGIPTVGRPVPVPTPPACATH